MYKNFIFTMIILLYSGCGNRYYTCKGQICDKECDKHFNACYQYYIKDKNNACNKDCQRCFEEVDLCDYKCEELELYVLKHRNDTQCIKDDLSPFYFYKYHFIED